MIKTMKTKQNKQRKDTVEDHLFIHLNSASSTVLKKSTISSCLKNKLKVQFNHIVQTSHSVLLVPHFIIMK